LFCFCFCNVFCLWFKKKNTNHEIFLLCIGFIFQMFYSFYTCIYFLL
jgi:hypothetical protein